MKIYNRVRASKCGIFLEGRHKYSCHIWTFNRLLPHSLHSPQRKSPRAGLWKLLRLVNSAGDKRRRFSATGLRVIQHLTATMYNVSPPRINHPSRQLSSCGRMCAFVAIMRFNAFRLVLLLCGRRVWRVTCFLHQQLSRGCMSEGFCKKPFVCRRVRDQTVTRTSLKMFGFAFHQKENRDSSPAPRLWFISHHPQPISSFLTHHLHLCFSPCWFKSKLHSLNLCHDVRRGCWASFCCLLARLWFCFPFQHQTRRISSIQRSKAAGIALQPTNTPRQELESASGVNLQLAVTSCFQENSVNLRFQAEQLEDSNMIPFDQSPRWFVPWSVTHCDPAAHRGYIAQPRALKGRRGWDRNTILLQVTLILKFKL